LEAKLFLSLPSLHSLAYNLRPEFFSYKYLEFQNQNLEFLSIFREKKSEREGTARNTPLSLNIGWAVVGTMFS
jgi:hypothetical protein